MEERAESLVVAPDQVDTLMRWLKEAKKELQGDGS
jgi:hypothetical protein